jgi:hypothetical protein
MKYITLFITVMLITVSDSTSQETSNNAESILIYQAGQVIDINPTSLHIQQTQTFSTDFISENTLGALNSSYDSMNNRIFLVVQREPFNPQTGIQKHSVIVLERSTDTEMELYTENNIMEISVSPNGQFVLIHRHLFLNQSIRPTTSSICVMNIQDQSCRDIASDRIIPIGNLYWVDNTRFTILSDQLKICSINNYTCSPIASLQDIYVKTVTTTNNPLQVLIAGYSQPYDGTADFYFVNIETQQRTLIYQLGKIPDVSYLNLSDDGRYLILQEFGYRYSVADVITEQRILTFDGIQPQWIPNSNLLVDVTLNGEQRQVVTLNIITGVRSIIYSSTQPFNLIVP